MNNFKSFWKLSNSDGPLTKSELIDIQNKISDLQSRGYPSSKIITALQKYNGKLVEKWKAERAYWTEVKTKDTKLVNEIGDDLDITKYEVILSPNACKKCRGLFENRVFKSNELEKSGRPIIPAHPNCYCILVPKG